MSVSRREFLRSGAICGLAAALPLSLASLAGAQSQDWSQGSELTLSAATADPYEAVARLNKASFSPCLASNFRFYAKTKNVDLKLVAIRDVASVSGKPTSGGECFDLVFQGPLSTVLPQNTYIVEQTRIGKFALLVVPIGRDAKNAYFEAVINRRLV